MLRALKALVASILVGEGVVQVAATAGPADETMILAYMLVPLVAVAALTVFVLAGLGADGAARVQRLGPLALAGMALLAAVMLAMEASKTGAATLARYAPLYLALILGPIATVALQWLILRRPKT